MAGPGRGVVGLFTTRTTLYTHLLGCVDLPLRLAGDSVYLLPAQWTTLAPVVEHAVAVEHATNPDWVSSNAYLSVECGLVQRGVVAPVDALAVDAPVGSATRSYVASSNGGVEGVGATGVEVVQSVGENVLCFVGAGVAYAVASPSRTGMRTVVRVVFDTNERHLGTPNPLLVPAG